LYTTNQSEILEVQKGIYENLELQESSAQNAHENDMLFNLSAVPTLNVNEQALCKGLNYYRIRSTIKCPQGFIRKQKLWAQMNCLLNFKIFLA